MQHINSSNEEEEGKALPSVSRKSFIDILFHRTFDGQHILQGYGEKCVQVRRERCLGQIGAYPRQGLLHRVKKKCTPFSVAYSITANDIPQITLPSAFYANSSHCFISKSKKSDRHHEILQFCLSRNG